VLLVFLYVSDDSAGAIYRLVPGSS
jgi:hypothetical protein